MYSIYHIITNYFIYHIKAPTVTAAEPETTSTNLPNGAQINTSATCASLASKAGNGNTVSCIIELKTVWFNFAAPPRTPITRKIDYTRLDWNLLSTASPAINAWMNPSNKFAMRIVHMFRTMYRRSTAIVACLMAEALDVQAIHMPAKVFNMYFFYVTKKLLLEKLSALLLYILESLWKINSISKNTTRRSIMSIMYNFTKLCFIK